MYVGFCLLCSADHVHGWKSCFPPPHGGDDGKFQDDAKTKKKGSLSVYDRTTLTCHNLLSGAE